VSAAQQIPSTWDHIGQSECAVGEEDGTPGVQIRTVAASLHTGTHLSHPSSSLHTPSTPYFWARPLERWNSCIPPSTRLWHWLGSHMDWDHAVVAAADADSVEMMPGASMAASTDPPPTTNTDFGNGVAEHQAPLPGEIFVRGDGTGDNLSNLQSTSPRNGHNEEAFFQTQDLLHPKEDSLLNPSQLDQIPGFAPFLPNPLLNLQQRRQLAALPPFPMSAQRPYSPSINSPTMGSASLTAPPFEANGGNSQSPQFAGYHYPLWQSTSNYSYTPSNVPYSIPGVPQGGSSVFRSPPTHTAGNGLPGPADLQQLAAENGPLPPLNAFPLTTFPSSFPMSSSTSTPPSATSTDANQERVSPNIMLPVPSAYYSADTGLGTASFTLPPLSPYLDQAEPFKRSKRRKMDISEAGSSGENASSGDAVRPYRCDHCSQSFNRNHDLKRHRRIHLSIKPYPCLSCEKAFSRKDALKRHAMVKGCKVPFAMQKGMPPQKPMQMDVSMPQPMSHHTMSIPSLPSGIMSIP